MSHPPRAESRPALKTLRRGLIALLAVCLGLLALRSYVGNVYRVGSASMEPTIHASPEQVFVRYDRGFRPRRFELAVFPAPAPESGVVVKRIVGLPGELLLISGGDLLIEGRRLAVDTPRPPAIPIFDSRLQSIGSAFLVPMAPFEAQAGGWRLDARGKRANLTFSRHATDDRMDASGELVLGTHEVNDLRLEATLGMQQSGKLALRLTEEGDAFELELEVHAGIIERASLTRQAGNAEPTVLAQLDRPAGDGLAPSCAVTFENIDNHLVALIAGKPLCADYEANTPLAGVVSENDRHRQPRVNLAANDLEVRIERLAVARDLYYTGEGTLGTGSPIALGPDGIFVLGDNSSDSRDSRFFGPVRLEDLAGRAAAVVWPPSAIRRLGELRSLVPPQAEGQ